MESSYPYQAANGKCHSFTKAFQTKAHTDVKQKSLPDLLAAVTQQPVSVGIDAGGVCGLWLQFYRSGVFDHWFCGTSLDHGVLVVGFGTEGSKD